MVCFDQISHTNLQNLISYKVMVHLSILKILHMLLHSAVYKWTLFIKNRPNLMKFVMQCEDLSLDFFSIFILTGCSSVVKLFKNWALLFQILQLVGNYPIMLSCHSCLFLLLILQD